MPGGIGAVVTPRLLRFEATDGSEYFYSPAGNVIGRLYAMDGGYVVNCAGWAAQSRSYHKARAALVTELRRRRWTLPE